MPVKLAHGIDSFVGNTSDKALPSANDGPRQLLRSAGPKPCSCSIIDETRLDLWVVLGTEPNLVLSRPTVTIEIDVAIRMILGYLVSFEPPSQTIELMSEQAFQRGNPEARRRDAWTADDERWSRLPD
jgi:hypothetical protein